MKSDKLFVVRKYIKAATASEAIRKEKRTPVDDCYVDDDWRRLANDRLAESCGFVIPKDK